MRKFRHITPRYVVNRIRWEWFQRTHPDAPWLTPDAVGLLQTLLQPDDVGLELGSGRSTLWLAKRCKRLMSVEHIPQWYEKVSALIAAQGLTNVEYHLVIPTGDGITDPCAYLDFIHRIPDESLGFALSDGGYRDMAPHAIIPKLQPGGMLIIDNVNWFLDHPTHAPASRYRRGPLNQRWEQFLERVRGWRYAWTTSGVSDTAIYFKPPSNDAESPSA